MLETENRGSPTENLALSQLQRTFLLVRQAENECIFLDIYVRFWKSQEVSQSFNMLQLSVERWGRVSPVCRYVLTIISVKILDKCDETSLTVIRIAVSLTLK